MTPFHFRLPSMTARASVSHAAWRGTLTVSTMLVVTSACAEKPSKAAPPATISGAVTESQLTSITLTPDAVRRLGIETVLLDSTAMAPTRTVGGEIVVPPGQAIPINAAVAGSVASMSAGVFPIAGQRVTQGQPLARLVPITPDMARVRQELATADARLRQAQLEADRVASLYAEKLVATRDQERAQADLAAARAALEAAQTLEQVAGGSAPAASVGSITIAAPSAGVVRTVSVAAGQIVSQGAPMFEIVRLDRLWVRVPVYAGDARLFSRHVPASVHALTGDQAGNGTMALVAIPVTAPPSADPLAASVDLYYAVQGASFAPGERVGVTIPLAPATGGTTKSRALAIPLAAVVRDLSGGAWVYVQTDSLTFTRRRVEVERVTGGMAVLALGPARGAKIVTTGVAELFGTEFGAGK